MVDCVFLSNEQEAGQDKQIRLVSYCSFRTQVKEAGTNVLASDTLVDPEPEPEPEPEHPPPDHVGRRDASGGLGSGELIV